jgi:oligosaccharide repeat unit polymerase
LAVLVFFISKKIFNSAASPIGIFCGVWFTVLFLYHLKLLPYYELHKSTWLYLLCGIGLYLVGCSIAICIGVLSKKNKSEKLFYTSVDIERLQKLIFIFYFIGMAGFIILFGRIIILFGFDVFLTNREVVHGNFAVRFLGYPFLLNGIVPVLAYIHFRLTKSNRKVMAFIIFSSMIVLLASVSRTNFLRTIMLITFCDIFLQISKRPVFNLSFAVLFALLFFATFHYVKNPNISDSIEKSSFRAPGIFKQLGPAYGYITSPLPTFEKMVKDIDEFGYGKYTFNTLTRLIHIVIPSIEIKEGSQKYYRNPIPCNVYTYLDVYYMDFGIYGIILFSFLQGVLATFFYMQMIWKGKAELFLFNAVIAWCLVITFFSNHFVKNSTVFLLIISYFVGKYIIFPTKKGYGSKKILEGL